MSVAFAPVELCASASDLGQDVLGLGRQNGGLRFLVGLEKILLQCGDQLRQMRDGNLTTQKIAPDEF